jgi:hypothetical protein
MAETIEQDCPLCGTAASYYLVTNRQRKYFKCAGCMLYQISVGAERDLLASAEWVRRSFADRARLVQEDHVFVILRSPTHGADPADAKITGKFVPVADIDR